MSRKIAGFGYFYYVNSKKNYRIRAERIEQTVVKYLGSLLKENGIMEQALQVFGDENTKLQELNREIAQKEKKFDNAKEFFK